MMMSNIIKIISWISVFILILSCSDGEAIPSFPSEGVLKLTKIEEVIDKGDQNIINLLNMVRGSVGTRGYGSKTIWSRKNDHGLGLYISANHVYGIDGWSSRRSDFFDVKTENVGIFEGSQIPPVSGEFDMGNSLYADYPLLHFEIATNATNSTINPSEDFYLGIVDNQRVEQKTFPQYPSAVNTLVPLEMYDPLNRTISMQTWDVPEVNSIAMLIGYPQDKVQYPNGAVTMGIILSETDAVRVIEELKLVGDPEGNIAYNNEVEFLVHARAIAGMSGGGVFNESGQLLGIMVRASTSGKAKGVVRVVRLEFIRSKVIEFYNTLSNIDKEKLEPFLSGEI